MSAGLPVVASRTGGIPELVNHDHNGFLVPPGDPVALADALERLALDAPLRERMGRAGRDTIIRGFDQERCAATLVGLIQRCGGLASETAVTFSAARSPEPAIRGPVLE
jgi:glycosyltransferase involved in cell wall biosynthesis